MARREHENLAPDYAETGEQLHELGRLRRTEGEPLDDMHRTFTRARVERALPGELLHLARDVGAIVPRRRSEYDATTTPVRRPSRSLSCAAGALLLPRLLVATRHETPRLGHVGALTLVVQVHLHRLVQHRLVHGAVEVFRRQGEVGVALGAAEL